MSIQTTFNELKAMRLLGLSEALEEQMQQHEGPARAAAVASRPWLLARRARSFRR